MKRSSQNHSKKESVRIANLSNKQLLEEALELAGGDDYDGCFTSDGSITYEILQEELYKRLDSWLKDDYSTASPTP